jgi:hypothetical protein
MNLIAYGYIPAVNFSSTLKTIGHVSAFFTEREKS